MIAQVPTGIACQQNPEAPADVLFFFFLFFFPHANGSYDIHKTSELET